MLKTSYWDPKAKRLRHRYLAYIGTKRIIPEEKAQEMAGRISEKLGRQVTVEDLRKVKKLRIVSDG